MKTLYCFCGNGTFEKRLFFSGFHNIAERPAFAKFLSTYRDSLKDGPVFLRQMKS